MNCSSKNKKLNARQQLLSSYITAYKDMYYVLLCLMIEVLMLNSIYAGTCRSNFPNRHCHVFHRPNSTVKSCNRANDGHFFSQNVISVHLVPF